MTGWQTPGHDEPNWQSMFAAAITHIAIGMSLAACALSSGISIQIDEVQIAITIKTWRLFFHNDESVVQALKNELISLLIAISH